MTFRCLIAAPLALLAACAGVHGSAGQSVALMADDRLLAAAALLVAAEEAPDAARRAPLIAQLDALGVAALPDEGEGEGEVEGKVEGQDRLGQWRRETGAADAPVYRGRTLGPAYRRAQLAPGQQLVIDQIFYAGQRAEMAAQTRGGQAVQLSVANGQANMVCEAQLSPSARCRWLPIFTERFKITLTNRGNTATSVYLVFE